MRISRMPLDWQAIVEQNNGLQRYLQALTAGREGTPHSWLYEHQDAEETLRQWISHLERMRRKSPMYEEIYQFDMKQVSKFGQQGAVPPISEAIQVESFQEQYDQTWTWPTPKRQLADILPRMKKLKLDDLQDVVHDMRERDTLVTNSGWPAFTKREREVLKYVQEWGVPHFRKRLFSKAISYPAIILFRQYNGKLRVVWMYPLLMNLMEYRATQPIQRAIQANTKYVTPWRGFEDVKRRFTQLWAAHPYAFGGDTTAMDAHMQRPQLQAVAESLRGSYKNDQDWKNMHATLMHVAKIPLVVGPNSVIIEQQHGIASGSGWTQLSETIFQILMFDEWIRRNNLSITINDGMGIGDDYVWFFDEAPDSQKIVDFWEENGLPGKPEKQSNDYYKCTFLQRLFIKGYMSREDKQVLGGIYPTIRALNSLLWPEKWHNPKDWNSDMFCIRTYMILENCVDHPLFEEFVRFVVKGQKDLLPFAKKSAEELLSIQQASRRLPGLNPSYNQEKREKPLGSFESIRYASTL